MNRIPKELKSVLWSYDLSKMDIEKSKKLIIQQVLNYGDWDDLKWLYRAYSKEDIAGVVKNPRRGIWFENVLNFWCLMLKIKLPRKVRERAIFRLGPEFMEQEAKMTKRTGRRAASTPGFHPGL